MSIDLDDNYTAIASPTSTSATNAGGTTANISFQLKGGLFTLTTLQIFNPNILQLKNELSEKIKQAPNFFHYAPVVLDFRLSNYPDVDLDFAALKQMLQEIHLIPVGIKNTSPAQTQAAVKHGFAQLRDTPNPREKDKIAPTPQPAPRSSAAKIITAPVRSGQQIYAPDGDLIVINQVSPGSELIADGSIHVYGPLRGRALAGVNGNTTARIFCQSLEAELVSVAGNYKLSEDIEKQAWKIPAQIYIKGDRLQISKL